MDNDEYELLERLARRKRQEEEIAAIREHNAKVEAALQPLGLRLVTRIDDPLLQYVNTKFGWTPVALIGETDANSNA